MNIRNATLAERHRKNVKFEQERTASIDYDVQRAGGTSKKSASKDSKSSSTDKKSSDDAKK